ncbi:MAG: serine hydrolase [Aureispira sp.]|nr:serine hydrolase [Aureispira sp.]
MKSLILIVLTLSASSLLGQNKINSKNLDRLMQEAQASNSSAVVIYQDNKLIKEWYTTQKPKPIATMSVTKSIVNLGIGLLLKEGKLNSIDQHVCEFYPEWNQGKKKTITIRQLLNHTSGIQMGDNEVYPSYDAIQLALSAELETDPGTAFYYNNKAVNLLAGIIEKASKQRMDLYIAERLFEPLAITDYEWQGDKVGTPHAMADLILYPKDLAKIGLLVLQKGEWEGKQVIEASWIEESTKAGQIFKPTCGLLWWVEYSSVTYIVDDIQLKEIKDFYGSELSEDFYAQLSEMKGTYESLDAFFTQFESVFGNNWKKKVCSKVDFRQVSLSRKKYGEPIGFSAQGAWGQWMYIYPDKNIVAVRMIDNYDTYNRTRDEFSEFGIRAYDLVK